jgi:hypothetical protein
MAKKPNNSASLPEPSHPFARWGGAAAISLGAMGVQSFPAHWDKAGAFLLPGLGYVVGKVLDHIINYVRADNLRKAQLRSVSANKEKIDNLYKQREDATRYGANPKIILAIDAAIVQIQQTNVDIMRK